MMSPSPSIWDILSIDKITRPFAAKRKLVSGSPKLGGSSPVIPDSRITQRNDRMRRIGFTLYVAIFRIDNLTPARESPNATGISCV